MFHRFFSTKSFVFSGVSSFFAVLLILQLPSLAQSGYWQQKINYKMDVQLDETTHLINGKQEIRYTNHSSDTLSRIFFHTYWNAFQPNSSMDVRSRELGTIQIGTNRDGTPRYDWDGRVTNRIYNLLPQEEGFTKFVSISIGGKLQTIIPHETIVEVPLTSPMLPGQTVTLQTVWQSQVPIQIRRSGRNNAEGVAYTMTQWYPKVVEYDAQGWNANPYVAREFHGVWGNYEVNITLAKQFKIGASGVLQNAAEIGWGYDKEGSELKSIKGNQRTWVFKADNVHDFAWSADPMYKHITRKPNNGPLLHFIYKEGGNNDMLWNATADSCAMAYPFMEKNFGNYPWPVYSFLQGGDGGMEYAMATMIRNHSLGTAIHEWMHSWYQQLMGTNESLYPWMDEGFTSYGESLVSAFIRNQKGFALNDDYRGYYNLVRSRLEEPMTTHSDHYSTNFAYSAAAYAKGAVFLGQLGYIISDSLLQKTLLAYHTQWKFKHPNTNDFIRIAEKVSGMELDWYKEYWVNGTKTIEYKIDSIWTVDTGTNIRIARIAPIPMPVDIVVTFKDGSQEVHYVPLNLMYGNKPAEGVLTRIIYPEQRWTHRQIIVNTSKKLNEIAAVEIDPSLRLADIDRKNNRLEINW